MRRVIFIRIALLCCVLWLTACSTTKYVADGEYLLDKVKIKTDNPDIKTSEAKNYLQQHPNYKIFGLLKWPLQVYSLSGRNENKWLNKQLRRIGEAPSILDNDLTVQSEMQIKRYLTNLGYMNAEIESSVDTSRHKKAVLKYFIKSGEPYRISNYRENIEDELIDSIVHIEPPRHKFFDSFFRINRNDYNSYVEVGNLFDRNVLDKERQRLTTLLRRNGYYAFNRDYINYLADSTFNNNSIDLELYIKPMEITDNAGEIVQRPHRRYYINKVSILTDYDPLNPEVTSDYHIADSAVSRGVHIYYGNKRRSIRPSVLQRSCYVIPGTLYNERSVEQTYTSYTALQALRYTSIHFDEFEENDTMKLNCTVYTAPEKIQGIRYDVEGTNSAGDLGFASSLTYQHRNMFKGSELFSAKIRGGYEYLSDISIAESNRNYWEFASEVSLHFPHFLFPFASYDFRRKIRATTEFRMSYDQQRRPEYHRSIVSGSWVYHWQNRLNNMARHTFKLLDVNYVSLPYIDKDFRDMLPETMYLYNYLDQFIVSMGYVYSFNNYDPMERHRNTYSFRFAFESAGNLLYGASKLLKAAKNKNNMYELFGVNYSEFMKFDLDYARSVIIDDRNSVAFHLGGGLAYPYGNSREIPFERRYYAGGANGNRGWSVRTLGPGSMPKNDNTSFVHQVGDIRLDANLEYRSKLFWKLEIALFVDAGNIWTIRKYDYQPNGNFDISRFYKEIAASYGLGIRLDFEYFLVRFDMGFKGYNPQEIDSRKWAVKNPNFKNNFAWHFAVGYPF